MTVSSSCKIVLKDHSGMLWAVTLTEWNVGNWWVQGNGNRYSIMASWEPISFGVCKELRNNTDNQAISLPLKAKFLCIDVG
jgi:hypothetical protein